MTNLTEKFDELQGDLQAHHGATIDKLDEIIAALGNAADPTAALADLLAELQGFRTDVNSTLGSIDTKLEQLEALALATEEIRVNSVEIRAGVEALPGEFATLGGKVDATTTAVQDNSDILVTQGTALSTLVNYAANINNTIGIKPSAAPDNLYTGLMSLLDKTDLLIQALGVFGAATDGTVLAYLDALVRNQCCGFRNTPPVVGACSNPYNSSEQVLLPWTLIGGTSQMFARFPDPPPSGITFGSTFSLAVDRSELDAVDWGEWRVYVQSDQPQYSDGDAFLRYPTNEWRTLEGTYPRAFSVDARGSIKVTLCRVSDYTDTPIEVGECIGGPATETANGHWSVTISGIPGSYTFNSNDNYYAYPAVGGFIGPNPANELTAISELGAQPVRIEFGSSPSDPAPIYAICNPSPE